MKKRLLSIYLCLLLIFPCLHLVASANDYVASKNSDVYHKESCFYVDRINSGNKVFYSSPEEAEKAGKHGCSRCNPSLGSKSSDSSNSKTNEKDYNAGYDAGYDVGYGKGFRGGYASGKDFGYKTGYADGEQDMEVTMQKELEIQVAAATETAYLICLFGAAPVVVLVTALLFSYISRRKRSELEAQIAKLQKDLQFARSATNNSHVSTTPKAPSIEDKTVYVSSKGRKYHCKYRCSGADVPIRFGELSQSFQPCRICVPGDVVRSTRPDKSSAISHIEYLNGSLILTFSSGAKYSYYNVPESVYNEMIVAPSKGKFYHEHIKDQYPYA